MIVVWRPLIRVFHWSLVASVATAWLSYEGADLLHEVAGYIGLGLVGLRLVIGFFSQSDFERFSSFVRSPRETLAYAGDLATGRETRHIGHNPLGGWMIVALLLVVAIVGLSGWLYTTDAYWGVAWVGNLHDFSAKLLLWLIGLHLLGVAFTSWRQKENLVGAMIRGKKRAGA